MRTLIFESYGNNEIRIGWNDLPVRVRADNDSSELRHREAQARVAEKTHEDWLRDNKLIELRDSDGQLYRGSSRVGFESVEIDPSRLDIICEFQGETPVASSERKRGYGAPVRPTAFTRNARHRLLEAGQLFDRFCAETHKGYFVTFTLPGGTTEAFDALARWSGFVANRVLQAVRDRSKSTLWFYVWELQKRGALHMHLFLAIDNKDPNLDYEQGLRDAWYRALFAVSDKESVDLFRHKDGDFCTVSQYWQYDYQAVKTTPSQYISKYVGKSANAPSRKSEMEGDSARFYPHRWWGMCREFTRLIEEYRFKVCMDAIEKDVCMDAMEDMSAMLEEFEPVLSHEYTADIEPERGSGRVIGRIHRRIFYFKAEDFPIVDVLFRKLAVSYLMRHAKHNRRWKYDSVNYEGMPVWQL